MLLDTTTPSSYNWQEQSSCNCGMVARAIMGDTTGNFVIQSVQSLVNRYYGFPERTHVLQCMFSKPFRNADTHSTWSNMVTDFCLLNPGQSAPEIFGRLLDAGLLVDDFVHLEHLSHPELIDPKWVLGAPYTVEDLKDRNGPPRHFEIAANAAYYMLQWAEVIETYHTANPTVTETLAITQPIQSSHDHSLATLNR